MAYRIGRDAAVLHLELIYADVPDPVVHDLLPWIEDVLSQVRRSALTLEELRELTECWRQRREVYFPDMDWADVHIVEPFDRPRPSLWWRIRHGSEPVPPDGGG
ncbi:hypothetical protein ACVGVM_08745 [Pseudonocardia bannensis]|uniref:Uncharacterized protein n=1 Tax=Pseudonocardia bannensis TaxID=630973 RepID=A0A848DI36_9PSEU|nr:hypothetical protein [Pseudonocardia bannensis]NMH92215.1 hypothetical protein [Pseudonocardia bannensis]